MNLDEGEGLLWLKNKSIWNHTQENKENLDEIVSFANRLVVLFLTSYFFSNIIIGFLQKVLKITILHNMTYILLPLFSLFFVLAIGSRLLFQTTPKQIIVGNRTAPKLPVIDSILLMLSLFFLEWGIVLLSLPFIERFSPNQYNPPIFLEFIIAIIGPCILGPVNEEILCRRIGFQYSQKHGTMFAVVTSSVMFALAHGDRFQVLYAFLLGLCAGILCAKTGSLLWPIFLHMAHNGFNIAMSYLFPYYEGIPSIRFYCLWALFVVLCVICFLLYAARQKINLRDFSIKTGVKKLWIQIKLDKSKYKAYFTSAGAFVLFFGVFLKLFVYKR